MKVEQKFPSKLPSEVPNFFLKKNPRNSYGFASDMIENGELWIISGRVGTTLDEF